MNPHATLILAVLISTILGVIPRGFSGAREVSDPILNISVAYLRGPCSDNPCPNGGKCRRTSRIYEYECLCDPGLSLKPCVDGGVCTESTCRKGGTCAPLDEKFIECHCPEGTGGTFCQDTPTLRQCTKDTCHNGGTCNEMNDGTTECLCDEHFAGATCELRKFQMPAGVYIEGPAVISYRLRLFAYVRDPGERLRMVVTIDNGVRYTSMHFVYYANERLAERRLGLARGSLPTGARYIYHFTHTFTEVRQYTIGLKLLQDDLVEYDSTEKLTVSGLENSQQTCVPVINVVNSGSSMFSAPHYLKRSNMVINSYIMESCDRIVETKWSLYMVTEEEPFPSDKNELSIDSVLTSKSALYLEFPPMYFPYGIYAVKITLLAWTGAIYDETYDVDWFYVDPSPLHAEIRGGPERTVPYDEILHLDASLSFDPDAEDDTHLTFQWYCKQIKGAPSSVCEEVEDEPPDGLDWIEIQANKLTKGAKYKFTVVVIDTKMQGRKESTAYQVVHLEGDGPVLDLQCRQNCFPKTNPYEKIYLRAICQDNCPVLHAQWTVLLNGQTVDGLINGNVDEMLIPPKALTLVGQYMIKYKATNSKGQEGYSTYLLHMNTPPQNGHCSLYPKEGIALKTAFDINCSDFEDEDVPVTYTVLQKVSKDLTGIHLLYHDIVPPTLGVLLNVGDEETGYLSTVFIRVEDNLGDYIAINFSVLVTPLKENSSTTIDTLSEVSGVRYKDDNVMKQLLEDGATSSALQVASCIVHTLTTIPEENQEAEDKILLEVADTLTQIPIVGVSSVRQVSQIVADMLQDDVGSHKMSSKAASTVRHAADELRMEVVNNEIPVPIEDVFNSSLNLFEASSTLLEPSEIKGGNISVDAVDVLMENEDLHNRDYVMSETEEEWERDLVNKLVSGSVVQSMVKMTDALSKVKVQGEGKYGLIGASINITVEKIESKDVEGKRVQAYNGDTLLIPNPVLNMPGNVTTVDVQLTSMKNNPFWWDPLTPILNTAVLGLDLKDSENEEDISTVVDENHPINLIFNVDIKCEKIYEYSLPIIPHHQLEDKDIHVHRVVLPKDMNLYVTFAGIPTEIEILVLATSSARPSVTDIITSGQSLPRYSTGADPYGIIVKATQNVEDRNQFYIGILPTNETIRKLLPHNALDEFPKQSIQADINKNCTTLTRYPKQSKVTLSYEMKTYSGRCVLWDETGESWKDTLCEVGEQTQEGKLHCKCTHLSMFSGSLLVAPNPLDPMLDIDFILSVNRNPVIVSFVVCILVLFLGLLIWASRKDKQDTEMLWANILDDNDLRDCYPYLIVVCTGYRLGAGTSANVVMQLQGLFTKSKPHLLKSSGTKVLGRGHQDYFLMTTRTCLGELAHLHLWHDGSGIASSWYCSKVLVRDLKTNRSWCFLVHQWLSVIHGRKTLRCTVEPATTDDITSWSYLIKHETFCALQRDHAWISIFVRHSRSIFTRCQRVGCCMSILTTAMLANIMFYGVPSEDPATQLDFGHFSISYDAIIIGIEAGLITLPINLAIIFLFSSCKPRKNLKYYEVIFTEDESTSSLSSSKAYFKNAESSMKLLSLPNRKGHRLSIEPLILEVSVVDPPEEELYEVKIEDILNDSCQLKSNQVPIRPVESEWRPLPWWCMYIAWGICISIIITSCILVSLYGLRYGPNRSWLWVLSILVSFLQSVFINQTLKVVLTTWLYFGITKQEPIVEEELTVPLQVPDLGHGQERRKSFTATVYQTYRPLPPKDISKLKSAGVLSTETKKYIRGTLIFVLFFTSVLILVYNNKNELAYYSTNTVAAMTIQGNYFDDGLPLYKVSLNEEVWQYLKWTLLPALHGETEDDDGDPRDAKWTIDPSILLLGVVRLRQVRVAPNRCIIVKEFRDYFTQCNAPYTYNDEDKNNYRSFWRSDRPAAQEEFADEYNPWAYSQAELLSTFSFRGEFESYSGGGYVIELGRSRHISTKIVEYLQNRTWIDYRTRALFIEFNLYCVNANLFNIVNLVLEKGPTGGFVASSQIMTVSMAYMHAFHKPMFVIAFIIFTLTILAYGIRLLQTLWKHGIKRFPLDIWNVIDFSIVLLAMLSVAAAIKQKWTVEEQMNNFRESSPNKFVNLYWAAYWDFVMSYLKAVGVCLVVMKLWKLLSIIKRCHLMQFTLWSTKSQLFGFAIMFGIVMAAFVSAGTLMFGHRVDEFRTVYNSGITAVLFLLQDFNYQSMEDANIILGPLYFIIFSYVMICFLTNILIAILNYGYNSACKRVSQMHNVHNLTEYVLQTWKQHLKIHTPATSQPRYRISDHKLELRLEQMRIHTAEFLEANLAQWRSGLKKSQYTSRRRMHDMLDASIVWLRHKLCKWWLDRRKYGPISLMQSRWHRRKRSVAPAILRDRMDQMKMMTAQYLNQRLGPLPSKHGKHAIFKRTSPLQRAEMWNDKVDKLLGERDE